MRSNKIFLQLSLILLLNLLFCVTAQADIDELYHLSIGTNISLFDTDISINDSSIDLENDLNYDRQTNASWVSGWYRVGDNHRIKLTYLPIKRSSFLESKKDITINDTTIKAGAFISSNTRSDIIDFSYIYSLHKSPQFEVGFSAGIYWLLNTTKTVAAGEIQAADADQPVFKSDYFTQQKLQAPMPLFGLTADYEFANNWRTNASLRYLSLQVNDISGKILSADIAIEYYFNNNWGIGASIAAFNLDAKSVGIITTTTLGWSLNGAQIYAIFKF